MRNGGLVVLAILGLAAACRRPELPEHASAERDVAAGRRLFERKCASCHNDNGDGRTIVARDFPYANLIDGRWRSDGSPEAIAAQLRNGHDPMPKFEGKLTEEEIRQIVTYVVALSRKGEADHPSRRAGNP